MNLPAYPFEADDDGLLFFFVSQSNEKQIAKIVAYTPLSDTRFNLGFGDYINSEVNDVEISNNGDGAKVLSTVIKTMFVFFERYPNKSILIEGSTERRTKIYNWLIARYFDELNNKFEILGLNEMGFVLFEKDKSYIAFEIKLKN